MAKANIATASTGVKADRFPLFLHKGSGQWTKKVNGKHVYFGKDKTAALKKYRDLLEGKAVDRGGSILLRDAVNRFLTAKQQASNAGSICLAHFTALHATCKRVIQQFGPLAKVRDLTPGDFERLRRRLERGRGLFATAREIRHVRSLFKYCYDAGLIEHPLRFGPGLSLPAAREFRRHKAENGPRILSAAEIRACLDAARPQVKAAILLGINAGFGASDCNRLSKHDVDLVGGWVSFARVKTGIGRRVPLWTDTVEALKLAIEKRPTPRADDDADCVFLTVRGKRWVRDNDKGVRCDELGDEFKKLMRAAGVTRRGSFYLLRHTFATVAAETGLQTAVNAIMGHSDHSVAGMYRERLPDEMLRKVTDHVHDWLFAKPKPR